MQSAERKQVWTFENGFVTEQPAIGAGVPGTLAAGRNVFRDENGVLRVARAPLNITETLPTATLGYTATLTANSDLVALSGGATAKTDIIEFQHLLIGRELYLVQRVISDTQIQIAPTPTASAAAQTVKKVPVLHQASLKRLSQTGGNAILFRENVYFSVGDGPLRVNGTVLNAALTASKQPQIAYPDPTTPDLYVVANAGFTKPNPPTCNPIAGGTKDMPAGDVWVRIARKRKGFPGYGSFSEPVKVTVVANGMIEVTPGAFAGAEGQNQWFIAVTKTGTAAGRAELYYGYGYTTNTTTPVTIEWKNEDLFAIGLVDIVHTPPPKCLFVQTLDDYICYCSTYGTPDSTGAATAPGSGIAVGRFDNPEAILTRGQTVNGEVIVGVQAGDSRLFLLCPNTIQIATFVGTEKKALTVRPHLLVGVFHQYSAVVVENQVWLFKGDELARGFERTEAEGVLDASFSARVRSVFTGFKAPRVFVGHDPRNAMIVCIHSNHQQGAGGGWQSLAMSYNLRSGTWNAPVLLGDGTTDFTVTACVDVQQELYLATADGLTWRWDASTANVTGYLATPALDGGTRDTLKVAGAVNVVANLNGAVQILRNPTKAALDSGAGAIARPFTHTATGESRQQRIWKLCLKGKSFALRGAFTLPGGAPVADAFELDFETDAGPNY